MHKRICFIYTETTGLHQTSQPVSKKILYNLARMVTMNYEIGYIENNIFIQEKYINHIIKPRCMYIPENTFQFHGITQEIANNKGKEIEFVIEELKANLKNVDIISSHNIDFHIKTIQSEAVRYNIILDFNKYIIIDTISFYHNYGYIKLKDLALKCDIKNILENNKNNLELIKLVFIKLYQNYENSIKC